ncbi:MAG TPA: hypothetical protein VF582_04985 [Allosphingosinicella sp.]|jgi:hypothetical protein
MRIILAPFLLPLLIRCTAPEPTAPIDRLEMRRSGWSAVDIELNSRGEGRYRLSQPDPEGRDGEFSITPRQFTTLLERLAVYRRQAVPMSEQSARQFIETSCPPGTPFVTDAGAIWIRWIGQNSDEHYLADLGCGRDAHARRNEELIGIIHSLPLPLTD